MEFVDRAVRHLIATERGIIQEAEIQQRTHTSKPKIDFLSLRDIIIRSMGDRQYIGEKEILDTLKLTLNLTDDRPAKARLRLLISKAILVSHGKAVSGDQVYKVARPVFCPQPIQNEKIESEITCAIAKASEQRQRISPLIADIK